MGIGTRSSAIAWLMRRHRGPARRPDREGLRLRAHRQHRGRHRRRVHRGLPASAYSASRSAADRRGDHQCGHRRGHPPGDHRPGPKSDLSRLTISAGALCTADVASRHFAVHKIALHPRRPNSPPGGQRPRRDKPWIFRTYSGHSNARESNALYRKNLSKGQTGLSVAFDLPTQTGYDSDHVLARGEVGKVGVPISHLGDMRALFADIPLAEMNTSMTINATAPWLLALYIAVADEQGAPRDKPAGHDAERHREGISLARHLRVSARALAAADQGHDPVHDGGDAEVESDERLLLSPAGGGRDAGAGARLRARDRDRDPRHREGLRRGEAGGVRRGGRAHLVLRQCRPALHHRAVQDARVLRAVGRDHARALRRDRPEAAAVPLRRAGELARPDRAAGREQRLPHPDRDAGRHAVEERARPRRAAAGLERGARPAAPVRPAMVAAHAADPRLRDRPARLRRHLRRLEGDRRQGRGVEARGARGARAHRRRWAARSRRSSRAT